ncbi:hypothetical protein TVAG_265970 [Trichomonas vaginalis G3]|uniref:Uncharacterized protein n=1 Tax=Trichomonas vaginalis (strain ATCC PRA-98 / G3) TaxID=412133 RepID=A2F2J4_TRIV3|nr:hypothetical protein TVAGG3_0980230 [Trichomonas vaginalis G3]EAY00894.1 hypothetical protein TVAG_265970 [Trichomonas vaginalis G3]KAI5489233.1 hypothetical protein TVAGG3_0980230 [Trichomonas vaginalis G3]|eukprot:XP_001313823.1 hypothetical protein [Trichomonas vaginalis G3]
MEESNKLNYYQEMKSCAEDLKIMTQLALLQNGSSDQQIISNLKNKIRKQYSPDKDQNSIEEDIDLVFKDLLKGANILNVYEQLRTPQRIFTQAKKYVCWHPRNRFRTRFL